MAKTGDNGNIEITLENVTLGFGAIWEPEIYKKDATSKPRFRARFHINKKTQGKLIDLVEDAIEDAKKAKWGNSPPRIKPHNIQFDDGDDSDYEQDHGTMILRASAPAKSRPTIIGRRKEPLVEKDGKPYPGCKVNAVVRCYAYDEFDDQVNFSLEAIQFVEDGEAFGGRQPLDIDEKFGDLGDGDDDRGSRSRDRDDDSRSRTRGSRDDDDRSSRSRGRDEGDDRGSRGRERDDDRGRSRDRDDDRGSRSRSRDDDDRGRSRDDDDRGRSRDDDRGRSRGRDDKISF